MMYIFIFVLTFVWNYIIANQSVDSKVLLTWLVVFATFCAVHTKILVREHPQYFIASYAYVALLFALAHSKKLGLWTMWEQSKYYF